MRTCKSHASTALLYVAKGHIFQRHRPPTVIFIQIQHHAINQSATDPGVVCGRPNS